MPSVLESFGWKTQSEFTAVPQLGIDSKINKLQLQSQKYFLVKENARATDGDVLAVTVKSGQGFNVTNTDLEQDEHSSYVRACTALFKEKSDALTATDRNIALSATAGVITTALSFIPFVGYLAALCWGSTLFFINQRTKAYEEYQESLNLLVSTCNWALGQGKSERHCTSTALTSNPDIRNMMVSLYPVLTEKQVRHLIADDIEEVFAGELHSYESKYGLSANKSSFFKNDDERIAQSKRSAEFHRCIYGFNKGKPTDFLDAFLSVFPDIYNSIVYGCKRLQHWWSKDSKPATTEASAPVEVSAAL